MVTVKAKRLNANGPMRSLAVSLFVAFSVSWAWLAPAFAQGRLVVETDAAKLDRICSLIEQSAAKAQISPHFFARLIWKESRFDSLAVSPAGAQGIAQFMPGTAALRGLADSFDITQAIPASADYLAELREKFGNLGLAAAAYNGGEARVTNWLGGRGFLPLETEDYVLTITGERADTFRNRSRTIRDLPVEPDKSFAQGCRRLPIIETRSPAMAQTLLKPWAVQVAGHFKRSVAERAWQRIERANRTVLDGLPHAISRAPTAMGRQSIYAVRVGADSRGAADAICARLRRNGGSCVVMKNR